MSYTVNTNDNNVSTTMDTKEKKWSIMDMYNTEFTLEGLVKTLDILDTFKRKYPNDETIQDFEEIVRDEICQLFGGTVLNEN